MESVSILFSIILNILSLLLELHILQQLATLDHVNYFLDSKYEIFHTFYRCCLVEFFLLILIQRHSHIQIILNLSNLLFFFFIILSAFLILFHLGSRIFLNHPLYYANLFPFYPLLSIYNRLLIFIFLFIYFYFFILLIHFINLIIHLI